MEKKKTYLITRITIGFIAVITLIGSIIFICCSQYSAKLTDLYDKNLAESCAKSIANILFDAPVDKYLKNEDKEQYNEKLAIINSICKNFGLKYIYVYIPYFQKNELTSLFYVNGIENKNVEGRELGTQVHWDFSTQEKEAYNGIESKKMLNLENKMGHTITSYAPVYNNAGKVIALVGADLDYDIVVKNLMWNIFKLIAFIIVCMVAIYAILITYLKIVFINPVTHISMKMENFIKEGNADSAVLNINSNDELGQMAYAFNKMVKDIKTYIKKLSDTQMETIFSLAKLAQSRDDDTGKHLERVQQYCNILAKELMENSKYSKLIDEDFIVNLVNASTLHDIGKVGISDLVLLKNGKLTPEEFNIIKKHTTIGYETLKEVSSKFKGNSFIEMGMVIALYHHERWDGKGYPTELKGEEIPLAARIMSIADVYDALSTKRVYKPAFEQEKCIEIIKEGAGSQFDPVIVEAFLQVADKFYKTRCQLED